ncbi:trypsin-like protein [Diaporthe eres]|nr:trypsin-like protein [Diaporthe eres]
MPALRRVEANMYLRSLISINLLPSIGHLQKLIRPDDQTVHASQLLAMKRRLVHASGRELHPAQMATTRTTVQHKSVHKEKNRRDGIGQNLPTSTKRNTVIGGLYRRPSYRAALPTYTISFIDFGQGGHITTIEDFNRAISVRDNTYLTLQIQYFNENKMVSLKMDETYWPSFLYTADKHRTLLFKSRLLNLAH